MGLVKLNHPSNEPFISANKPVSPGVLLCYRSRRLGILDPSIPEAAFCRANRDNGTNCLHLRVYVTSRAPSRGSAVVTAVSHLQLQSGCVTMAAPILERRVLLWCLM